MNQVLNSQVQQLLAQLIESGQEVGLQVAAYVGDELVVDTWAGLADEATSRPVAGDTLFTCWSVTKGFAATCLHILADRGKVAYDTSIATYWPEFAVNGKTTATVRHALTHMAGVPQMPAQVTPEMLTDWDAMCTAIAALEPIWTFGSQVGYHAWTYGWIIGEIVRRVDGRSIAQFAQEELCQPLGITDFYLGIPDAVESRVATLRDEPRQSEPEVSELHPKAMPDQITNAATVNRPDVRRASIPGAGGIMNARSLARHYAMLANGGELDGVRLLSPERIDLIRACAIDAEDIVLNTRTRRGLGYTLGGGPAIFGNEIMGWSGKEFGHGGLGGSIGYADPEHRFAFGLTKTLLKRDEARTDSAAFKLAELLRSQLY